MYADHVAAGCTLHVQNLEAGYAFTLEAGYAHKEKVYMHIR